MSQQTAHSRTMIGLLERLKGGDRRSIGAVPQVVTQVLHEPGLFPRVFDGMTDTDPLVRMRCADAVEKITAACPALLVSYTTRLIRLAAAAEQHAIRPVAFVRGRG